MVSIIYPHPVIHNQALRLSLENLQRGNYQVRVYDMKGQLVQQQIIAYENGNCVQAIFLSNNLNGIYPTEVSNQLMRLVKTFVTE